MLLKFDLLALVKNPNQIFISYHILLCILLQSLAAIDCGCILGGIVSAWCVVLHSCFLKMPVHLHGHLTISVDFVVGNLMNHLWGFFSPKEFQEFFFFFFC